MSADGLMSPNVPTLANGAAPTAPPPASDPGELGPSAAPRPAPRPSAPENPRARGHSPARDTYEQIRHAQDHAPGDTPPPPATDQQQPAPPVGEKHKIGQYEVSETELGAMMQRQAAEDLRKATLPPSPADYKVAIPEGMKLPGDQQFKFDEAGNKAAFDAARAWAHNKGMTQSDFSEMLGLYASQEAQQHAVLAERSRQEVAKVGVNAPQRVDAIGKWITGTVGEKDAVPIRATIVTDAHVRFYEKIMHQITTQGGASFSQSHRVPPDTNTIPGFEKMSFEQQRLAQDQLAARRGGYGR
jgi:hypothetical protein